MLAAKNLPVMMLALEAVNANETSKYLAMNVMKPVLMDCSITMVKLMNSHTGLLTNRHSCRGNAGEWRKRILSVKKN